ncbi:MAG: hypothetical protein AB1750_05115 [Chloroflexota bacterium]
MLIAEPKSPVEYPTACGGHLREPGDHPSAEFEGRRVYFCTRACLRVFESDPERFMAGEIPHPIEEE